LFIPGVDDIYIKINKSAFIHLCPKCGVFVDIAHHPICPGCHYLFGLSDLADCKACIQISLLRQQLVEYVSKSICFE